MSDVERERLATWLESLASPTLTNDPFIRAADWAAKLIRSYPGAHPPGEAMTNLAEFLLARIAEDEADARAASFLRPTGPDPTFVSPAAGLLRMQQRFSPARVLTECDAKRRIVKTCTAVIEDDEGKNYYSDGWDGLSLAKATLRRLALPYADHPDYDETWRP